MRKENKWWGPNIFSLDLQKCFLPKMKRKLKEKMELLNEQKMSLCTCTWAFSSIKQPIFSLQFSPHFREKTFWWARRENTLGPPFIFLSLHPTKHTPKKFFFPFSLQNFLSTLFRLQTNTSLRLKSRK